MDILDQILTQESGDYIWIDLHLHTLHTDRANKLHLKTSP